MASSIEGVATIESPGKLNVRFPSMPVNVKAPYWVIGTDYDSYAVVYSCSDVGIIFSARTVWILTRDRNPSLEVLQKGYQVLEMNRISKAYLMRTDQTHCNKDEGENNV